MRAGLPEPDGHMQNQLPEESGKKAEMSMLSKAFESDREIKHRQLDTMKEVDLMGVIKFYELR